jgi:hypothetical protein
VAFWLMALNEALIALAPPAAGGQSWFYPLRVIAFLLIAAAIVRKNAAAPREENTGEPDEG